MRSLSKWNLSFIPVPSFLSSLRDCLWPWGNLLTLGKRSHGAGHVRVRLRKWEMSFALFFSFSISMSSAQFPRVLEINLITQGLCRGPPLLVFACWDAWVLTFLAPSVGGCFSSQSVSCGAQASFCLLVPLGNPPRPLAIPPVLPSLRSCPSWNSPTSSLFF